MQRSLIQHLEFTRTDLGGPWECWRFDTYPNHFNVPWTPVTLPHCWNASDAVDPDTTYYQGAGWYRTRINPDNPYPDGRTVLHFEGCGQRAAVYIHTTRVASHTGGYDEWDADLTDALAAYREAHGDGDIPLAIRCDNTRDLETIPSDTADFNLYGGIYRPLHLEYRPALDWDAIRLEPELTAPESGRLAIQASLAGTAEPESCELRLLIQGPDGSTVYEDSRSTVHWTGLRELWNIELPGIQPWHPDTPRLYTVQLSLKSAAGETTRCFNTAFRRFEFRKNGPFFLNGERLLLRGTHRHEDHAGMGAAMTEAVIRREMQLIKDMGVNFIRLGHYQQRDLVLELCDRLGIVVWEEIPWCRGGLGGDSYRQQAMDMLENMIRQHRNHPSVIIWGLGNENDWPADFEAFDETAIKDFMKQLHDRSHELDPARKTAIRRCAFCADIVDVYSPSIWAGWYRGLYTDYKQATLDEIAQVDHFLHVEWGGDSHAGRHTEDSARGLESIQGGQGVDEKDGDFFLEGGDARASRDTDWTESYICDLFDWHLKEQETMPGLTGTAQWVFKDFSTPVRPENPVPYVNQKGVVERDLTPKEAYYVFQSYWTTTPMVRLYGHDWPVRWGARDETKQVKVYSNCPKVELFINGQSSGTRKRNSRDFPAAGLRWQVTFQPGENELKAVGRHPDGTVEDMLHQVYQTDTWEAPAALRAEPVRYDGDTATVTVQLVDGRGVPCLDAKNVLRFSLAGPGRLADNLGTVTGSRVVEARNGRAAISLETAAAENMLCAVVDGLPPCFVNVHPSARG